MLDQANRYQFFGTFVHVGNSDNKIGNNIQIGWTMSKLKILVSAFFLAFSLLFTSCGDSGTNVTIPGLQGPTVVINGNQVLVSMILENLVIDGGLRYNIPDHPGSYLEIGPDLQSGGTLVSFSFDINDVLNGELRGFDPQRLPGGRALPGVATGSLPALAFSIERFHNISIYYGPKAFGLFVPANIGVTGAMASFRYYIGGKRMGNLTIVGSDENGENAGVLLLLDMNATIKNKLKEHAQQF